MRGGFAIVLLSLLGAVGCSDGAADIQATQHGKRLNLVAGDDEQHGDFIKRPCPVATVNRHLSQATAQRRAVALYRDVAGVVLTDPKSGAQHLEQWILSQDGTEVRSRLCPVKAIGGVVFSECGSWGSPQTVGRSRTLRRARDDPQLFDVPLHGFLASESSSSSRRWSSTWRATSASSARAR